MNEQFEHISEESEQPEQNQYEYIDPNASYDSQNYYNYNSGNVMPNNTEDESAMSLGDWVVTILVMFIPCAGIIIYLIWAFGKNGNVNRRNYCRAYLLIYAVIMVIYLIIALVFGAAIAGNL